MDDGIDMYSSGVVAAVRNVVQNALRHGVQRLLVQVGCRLPWIDLVCFTGGLSSAVHQHTPVGVFQKRCLQTLAYRDQPVPIYSTASSNVREVDRSSSLQLFSTDCHSIQLVGILHYVYCDAVSTPKMIYPSGGQFCG